VLHNLLTPHFVAAKTFLPLVADREGSTYTFITGVSGERVIAPGTGLLTVAIAGLFSLIKVLQGEWKVSISSSSEDLPVAYAPSSEIGKGC